MERRSFITLLAAAPSLATLLAACGDDTTATPTTRPGSTPGTGDHETLRSDMARVTEGRNATTAATAVNDFAADLYDLLVTQDPQANLVFSPASIAIALAMTAAGARGTTLDEMVAVLHADPDMAAFHRSMNGLSASLDGLDATRDNTAEGGTGVSEVKLEITNSLWGQAGLAFEQAFLDLLAAEYGAGMETVDYKADPEAARALINAWVADATAGRIPDLLAPGTLTPDSRLTLVNAIYLKANWMEAFDENATADEPFTTAAGDDVTVKMMHRGAEMAYAEGDGWQAVDVPYVFGTLSLTVAMPDDPGVTPPYGEVVAGLGRRPVELGLPRFDIETSTSLAQALADLGMPTAFSGTADFTGMTTEVGLAIGDVIHQANITTDETGTEAAAATAVIMVETAAPEPQEPVTLTIDRPFTFWLRERSTDAVVFMGRVTDPSQTRG